LNFSLSLVDRFTRLAVMTTSFHRKQERGIVKKV
jgi:hypothetical protein